MWTPPTCVLPQPRTRAMRVYPRQPMKVSRNPSSIASAGSRPASYTADS